jgi:hypothetical protein
VIKELFFGGFIYIYTLYYYQLIIMIFRPLFYFNLYFGFDLKTNFNYGSSREVCSKDEKNNLKISNLNF